MSINIKSLKAKHGDCIILSYGKKLESKILIDGGIGIECKKQLSSFFDELKMHGKDLKLVILTHIDSDHIEGILKIFSKNTFDFTIINSIWFNYGRKLYDRLQLEKKSSYDIKIKNQLTKISLVQAKNFEEVIEQRIPSWEIVKKLEVYEVDGARFTILSPSISTLREFYTRYEVDEKEIRISSENDYQLSINHLNNKIYEEDQSLANRSSIAFLFEYDNKKLLFLGDAISEEIESSLMELGYSEDNPIEVICCKIAHHASKNNTNNRLIRMMNCHNFIISTCMTASGRPSKECLSRIICNTNGKVNFYCNYDIDYKRIFTEVEMKNYSFEFKNIDTQGIILEELTND